MVQEQPYKLPSVMSLWRHHGAENAEQGEGNADSAECAVEISNTSIERQGFVARHRRARSLVSEQDLVRFRAEVLGISPTSSGTLDAADEDDELTELNLAFSSASMSMTSNTSSSASSTGPPPSPNSNSPAGTGPFATLYDHSNNNNNGNSFNSSGPVMAGMSRQIPSPSTPSTQNGGMAPMNVGMPVNAGHQMDLNHLYEMVLELSDVLKNNRDMTKGIIDSAEEIMKRAAAEGASPTLQQVNGEVTVTRIAELERSLAREKSLVEALKREQIENTKLIGEYETAVGTMVEQIRNYCQNNNMHYLAQRRHYSNLLQAERDAHLESRLDRDNWHAKAMRCSEMIRTAYRLRCDEEEVPIRIISGLQNEVRAYRNALGMEPEKPEEEYGWEILKDLPAGVD
ncbi:conserved hypothetical protein [Histoplasma capsulatum H143]|uniref:Uncharacterized protein n=1 Tax=Ajellomyces capsulatus (strain H143) TaxID=544712 RepID=C6HT64_AJECH|nr:conserved hypothetical protein [Histoplasma capsulatum H143]